MFLYHSFCSQTGVWSSLPQVEEEFITPLRSSLQEARSVYCHKLAELKDGKGGKVVKWIVGINTYTL